MRHFVRHKAALAHRAVRKHAVRSFADIGGCWGVHAGYTVHVLSKNRIDKAYVADGNVNKQSRAAGRPYPQLEFIEGQFNEPTFIEPFPQVDALIMFSILLHQANLDWDQFLEAWAGKARVFIIYNQMWKKSNRTTRFVDEGLQWYLDNVYFTDKDKIVEWFGKLDELHPSGRKWRDMQYYWQFGITASDLVGKMEALGFRLDLFENFGSFHPSKTPWFENEGFVFVRAQVETSLSLLGGVAMHFNIHEAKIHFSKLVAAVEAGEKVVICRDGKPIMECVPTRGRPFPFGSWGELTTGGSGLAYLADPTDQDLLDSMGL